jgi:hypothetical protein
MSLAGSLGAVAAAWGAELARLGVDVEPERADVKPGWIALVIVLALCVVTTLLWLNMRKQLGKVRFEEKEAPPRRGGEPPAA